MTNNRTQQTHGYPLGWNHASVPPGKEHAPRGHSLRWSALLLLMLALFSLIPQKASAWDEWPEIWSEKADITPANPWTSFTMRYFMWNGDNCNWEAHQDLYVYVDGVLQGNMRRLIYFSSNENDVNNNWKYHWADWQDCIFVIGNAWDGGGDNCKSVRIYVLFKNNTVGEKHTVEFEGTWVRYFDEWAKYSPDNPADGKHLIFTTNAVSADEPENGGTLARQEDGKVKWTSPSFPTFNNDANWYWHGDVGYDINGWNKTQSFTKAGNDATPVTVTFDVDANDRNYHWGSGKVKYYLTNDNIEKSLYTGDKSDEWSELNCYDVTGYYSYNSDGTLVFITQNGNKKLGDQKFTVNFIPKTSQWDIYTDGYPRPKNLQTSYDMWKKQVSLSWETDIRDNNHKNTGGKWQIDRYDSKSGTKTTVTTLDYSSTSYTDQDGALEYSDNTENRYKYTVTFVPTNWQASSVPDLSTSRNVDILRQFNYTGPSFSPKENSIVVGWEHDKINTSTGGKFTLYRCEYKPSMVKSDGKTFDEDKVMSAMKAIATVDAKNTDTYNSFEDDKDLGNRCKSYLYRVGIDLLDKTFYSPIKGPAQISGVTKLTSFKANRGTYSGLVKLQWDVKQVGSEPTRFVVSRRQLGTDEAMQEIYITSGTDSRYFYDDVTALPGMYYEYKVDVQNSCTDSETGETTYSSVDFESTDGFCQTRGVISGRITYGNGTAVPNAKVRLKKTSDDDNDTNQFYSLHVASQSGISLPMPASKGKALFVDKPFTFQMYVRPEASSNADHYLLDAPQRFSLKTSGSEQELQLWVGSWQGTGLKLPVGKFSNVSLSNNGDSEWTVRVVSGDTINGYKVLSKKLNTSKIVAWDNDSIFFGASKGYQDILSFVGNIDEVRLWNKVLTDEEIMSNYDRVLSGTETGLKLYWPLDEGYDNLMYAYDYSKTSGIANENHGVIHAGATFDGQFVPEDYQLSLYARTDSVGNYLIRGVPFSGDGDTYTVTPTLGIHKFSPAYDTRFVSSQALNFNGVDFEDVSSFPVKGRILYQGTTIGVEDANIYVDGTICSKDGEAIRSKADGTFKIDVPIGDHFITVKKNGHTFVNNGRYPADPDSVGTRFTFEQEPENPISFTDSTYVTVAGRVAGGEIQNGKLLGMKQSKANIGKAILTLDYTQSANTQINMIRDPKGTSYEMVDNPEDRPFLAATDKIKSKAYVAKGENVITIETDPETGEWAAKLLPLNYTVKTAYIPSQKKITFSKSAINASNPLVSYTDSLTNDSGKVVDKFTYNAVCKMMYKAPSHLDVTENEDGSFGDASVKVKDVNDDEHEIPLYTVLPNGEISYRFGYPVYSMASTYKYNLKAYELYQNFDNAPDSVVPDEVPLGNKDVTIKNQYASTTSVVVTDSTGMYKPGDVYEVKDNKFQLDSAGCLIYQFQVGYPNQTSPYTRGITINYDDGGDVPAAWDQNTTFKAIVLGSIPTGNNFVTEGPDEVMMVLRDPPGTGSSTTWTKGTSCTYTKTYNYGTDESVGLNTTSYFGAETTLGTGMGVMVFQDFKAKWTLGVNADVAFSFNNMQSESRTITAARDISTSGESDFVGAPGDVFIGASKNMIFGKAHQVMVKWDNTTNNADDATLTMEDAIAIGQQFGTSFFYTQNFLENVQIPQWEELRNALIKPVSDLSSVRQPAAGSDPVYVSLLSPDDPKFGTNNDDVDTWGSQAKTFKIENGRFVGPSYTMILPVDWEKNNYQDKVNWYNMQITKWKQQLYNNEEMKVKCINNRDKYLKENFSFDAGSSITDTYTQEKTESRNNTETENLNFSFSQEIGTQINGTGVVFNVHETAGTTFSQEQGRDSTTTFSTQFSLVENGDDDYLSVDVYRAPDNFGPIFVTRGGATSCPYEDEVTTKYYQPGTVIQEKTVQIENPEIEAETQTLTGIPAGSVGTLVVNLRNNSDTDEDVWYNLNVVDDSNPDGLVVKLDGKSLPHTVLVKAGENMKKTFTVQQSNPDVLNYENIKLRISSQCQPDNTGVFPEIADTTDFSVYFQPTCSEVKLESDQTLVNANTKTPVVFSISGYNYSMKSLKGIRLEYMRKGAADFNKLQEWTKDTAKLKTDSTLLALPALQGTDKLTFVLDMNGSDWTDDDYVFRAVTDCRQGGNEVNNESDEITIHRDRSVPQLIATPTPSSGIYGIGSDLTVTFNEDIQAGALNDLTNFNVVGVLNESRVAHDVALSLTGDEEATTDAVMDLSGKSFATSFWLKYTSDGQLLRHGSADNNFTLAIENGCLAVSVAGTKKLSAQTLPVDKWLYLNVSYNAADQSVSAGYAQDASEVILMEHEPTAAYSGNGPIKIGGNNLEAKIQELAIWNNSRSLAEAQATMYTTKSQFTSGLIGYWQFNEGHGNVATDKARSRNMTLPSENAWWISGDNYALVLDGTKAVTVDISALNTTPSEDYLLEAWFKADAGQDSITSVLSTKSTDLRLNAAGHMELAVKGSAEEVSTDNLRDGQWHHVALNVLKSTNGSAIVYVDGEQRKQFASSAVPALTGDKLALGAHPTAVDETGVPYKQMLRGAIDEVRIWKGRRTAGVIRDNMYNRVAANSDGLVAYYPMERLGLDEYNQIVTTSNLNDAVTDTIPLAMFDSYAYAVDSLVSSKENTAALKVAPSQVNVEFSYVASERQIKLTLEEEPYKIEGCNIYITVKKVKDNSDNYCDPITWGVYVQQDHLRWVEPEVSVTKPSAVEQTFTATIENRGSESEAWTISGMPAWLTADVESGSLFPLGKSDITFTVSPSLPIGTYETTVFLTGSQNINAPLAITVTAEGNAPQWVATPGESTMTIVGQLKIDNVLSSDAKDIVAAFRGSECVGVASPKYFSRFDSYLVLMNVYGSSNESSDLTYKIYDASTGITYPSVEVSDQEAYTFVADKAVGTFNEPAIFSPMTKIEQDLSQDKAGWAWFSLYAMPDDPSPKAVFSHSRDAVASITGNTASLIAWTGSLKSFAYNTMYKLNAKKAFTESIIGEPVSTNDYVITLNNGWNWIGYPVQGINSLSAAFASAEPADGDIVKGQTSFSIYSGGDWIGTLEAMVPGKGYMYKSADASGKSFFYPSVSAQGRQNAPRRASADEQDITYCENNMNVIAKVMDEQGYELSDAAIRVQTADELRGVASQPVYGNEYFLTVQGNVDGEELIVMVERDGISYNVGSIFFKADAVYGTLNEPVVLKLGGANSINGITDVDGTATGNVYDLGGRQVSKNRFNNGQLPKGVYIHDGKKVVK